MGTKSGARDAIQGPKVGLGRPHDLRMGSLDAAGGAKQPIKAPLGIYIGIIWVPGWV